MVSTRAKRSSAQARQVVESCPPENSTMAVSSDSMATMWRCSAGAASAIAPAAGTGGEQRRHGARGEHPAGALVRLGKGAGRAGEVEGADGGAVPARRYAHLGAAAERGQLVMVGEDGAHRLGAVGDQDLAALEHGGAPGIAPRRLAPADGVGIGPARMDALDL